MATTLLALLGCAAVPGAPSAIELTALPGWSEEIALNAAAAMLSGCRTFSSLPSEQELPGIAAGLVAGDWREPCRDLALASNSGSGALADALGLGFVALASQGSGVPALITGYYEPEIAGSRTKGGAYRWPIYSLPEDPTRFDRAQISAGALKGEGLELLYLKDPIDAFFLQVQGSGRVRLEDGSIARVGFAGHNGRDYVAIGKLMVEAGLLTREEVSMQSIRRTLEARPEDIQDWLDRNPRFVFFRENAGPGPVGAMGTVLTPLVSVATDPAHVAMGQPIWLNAAWPSDGAGKRAGDPLQILAVAEDKGGAIKGQGRIDLFWGAGELAEEMAGRMRVEGAYYPIVPRAWLLRTGRAPGS